MPGKAEIIRIVWEIIRRIRFTLWDKCVTITKSIYKWFSTCGAKLHNRC